MTPADRIRAAIQAEIQRSPAPLTADDLAAAVCEALADGLVVADVVPLIETSVVADGLRKNAAELREGAGRLRSGWDVKCE